MRQRTTILAVTAAAVALLALPTAMPPRPLLVWNASASLPLGFYRIVSPEHLRVGDLALVRMPGAWGRMFAERGYLPANVPLLKRIAAVTGSTICRHGAAVAIDGQQQAMALTVDRLGRPMPVWSGCHVLGAAEVFLLIGDHPASLDGRYFGATERAAVVGRAIPIWTFTDAD